MRNNRKKWKGDHILSARSESEEMSKVPYEARKEANDYE